MTRRSVNASQRLLVTIRYGALWLSLLATIRYGALSVCLEYLTVRAGGSRMPS